MDKVFAPLLYKNLKNYLDDALNHHQTLEEHIAGVRQMLQCLREANLFCNPKKCEFRKPKIEFLGVDISQHGFEMDEKKTSMIAGWQNLTSVQGVWEFFRFVNFYRQWILGFSDIA